MVAFNNEGLSKQVAIADALLDTLRMYAKAIEEHEVKSEHVEIAVESWADETDDVLNVLSVCNFLWSTIRALAERKVKERSDG